MPGERQYNAGPSFVSGAIALHSATDEEPTMMGAFFAMTELASTTAVWGFDWSSRTTNLIGRPLIPPPLLTIVSMMPSVRTCSRPRNDSAPVAARIALISYGSAPAPGRGIEDSASTSVRTSKFFIGTLLRSAPQQHPRAARRERRESRRNDHRDAKPLEQIVRQCDDDAESRDSEKPGRPCDRVVDAGCDSGMLARDGIHDRRRQR